ATSVTANLSTGTASKGANGTDSLSGITTVIGSATATNSLSGSAAAELLKGGNANDTIVGGGNDTVAGGGGSNSLAGSYGTVTDSYTSSSTGVTVDLTTGRATTSGGTDTLSGITNILGSATGGNSLKGAGASD